MPNFRWSPQAKTITDMRRSDSNLPLRPISKRRLKQMNKPWIASGVRKSIKVKNQLFRSSYTNKYKLYRNKILTLTRVNKKLYYHTHFEQNANNLKNTWKVINLQINRNKRNIKQITALRKPNNVGIPYNTSEIPDIMNNHFATTVCPQKSTLYRNYPIVIRVEIILLFFGTHSLYRK